MLADFLCARSPIQVVGAMPISLVLQVAPGQSEAVALKTRNLARGFSIRVVGRPRSRGRISVRPIEPIFR